VTYRRALRAGVRKPPRTEPAGAGSERPLWHGCYRRAELFRSARID
jgi:hypothetical protein